MPKIPGVSHGDAVRVLKKLGFRIAREGKHTVILGSGPILTIPRQQTINAYTMDGNAKDADLHHGNFVNYSDSLVEQTAPGNATFRRTCASRLDRLEGWNVGSAGVALSFFYCH